MIALGLGLALRLVEPGEVSDLRPRADALEYDLASIALVRDGEYALPLEGRSYPPRYTIGYPLLTALGRGFSGEMHEPGFGAVVSIGLILLTPRGGSVEGIWWAIASLLLVRGLVLAAGYRRSALTAVRS